MLHNQGDTGTGAANTKPTLYTGIAASTGLYAGIAAISVLAIALSIALVAVIAKKCHAKPTNGIPEELSTRGQLKVAEPPIYEDIVTVPPEMEPSIKMDGNDAYTTIKH